MRRGLLAFFTFCSLFLGGLALTIWTDSRNLGPFLVILSFVSPIFILGKPIPVKDLDNGDGRFLGPGVPSIYNGYSFTATNYFGDHDYFSDD